MTDRDGNRSNPYKPSPSMCCEACIFGGSQHAVWCDLYWRPAPLEIFMPDGFTIRTLLHPTKRNQG